jgi:hypothetical protein
MAVNPYLWAIVVGGGVEVKGLVGVEGLGDGVVGGEGHKDIRGLGKMQNFARGGRGARWFGL